MIIRIVMYFCLLILINSVAGKVTISFKDITAPIDINNAIDHLEKLESPSKIKETIPNSQNPDISKDIEELTRDVSKNESSTEVATTVALETVITSLNKSNDVKDNLIETEDFKPDEGNNKIHDEPLILTPLINEGKLQKARQYSKVNPELFLGVESYSGFFTVNETYNSNIYVWYFPVPKKPVNETPWIIWLQGGPGVSSLTGVFDEFGPFQVEKQSTLVKNPYTWLQNHSLVFIDNPVGTGYSFTENENGYATDMATYTHHLYKTLVQFLQVFPELRTAPLYIAGESYAGKYVPAFAMEIHNNKNRPGENVNLKGLMAGNAYIEPNMIADITRPFYQFGMLAKEQVKMVQPLVDAFQNDIANNRSVAAKEKWNGLVAILLFISHQKQAYNFLQDEINVGRYKAFLDRPEIKEALHVAEAEHSFLNVTVNMKLAPDFLTNTRPLFESLLNEYSVLVYCGQLDQMLPCAGSSERYREWKWDGSEEFLNATRLPFLMRRKLLGYIKSGGHLTEAVIRGAGHMASQDAPAATQLLITKWTHGHIFNQATESFNALVDEFLKQHTSNKSYSNLFGYL